jgi:orotate phosphoribosyltransferase
VILDTEVRDIIKRFFEIKAIDVRTQRELVNSNGHLSPVSVDYTKIFSDPNLRKRVLLQWVRFLENKLGARPSGDSIIVGTAVAGIAPAYSLADAMNCQFAYTHVKDTSGHAERYIEGVWSPGVNVIVADDLVLTGQTVVRTVEHLRSEGANVLCATCISCSEFSASVRGLREANITMHSLTKLTEIFDVAYSMGLMGNREMRTVMEWMSEHEVAIF